MGDPDSARGPGPITDLCQHDGAGVFSCPCNSIGDSGDCRGKFEFNSGLWTDDQFWARRVPGYRSLRSGHYEIYNGFIHIGIAIGVSAAFAFLTGLVCLRTRGVNFIMITMAFSMMVFFAFVSIEEYGGDDGLVIEVRSKFGQWVNLENDTVLYYVCFVSLLGILYLIRRIVHSRFGMVIQGARGNEGRMQSLGFDTFRYRLVCYVIAGALCGYAGALLGNFTSFISPEMMDWTRSGELIFMVVLGGTSSLFGPVLGAGLFILLEEILSGFWLYWQLIFGIFLILVVLFAKGGIDSWLGRRPER